LWLNWPIDKDDVFSVQGKVEFQNDNNPALANITNNDPKLVAALMYSDWGYTGFCHCSSKYAINMKPLMVGFNSTSTLVDLFEHFFPIESLCEFILVNVNKNINGPPER
jgi:hypothetical protein